MRLALLTLALAITTAYARPVAAQGLDSSGLRNAAVPGGVTYPFCPSLEERP